MTVHDTAEKTWRHLDFFQRVLPHVWMWLPLLLVYFAPYAGWMWYSLVLHAPQFFDTVTAPSPQHHAVCNSPFLPKRFKDGKRVGVRVEG